MIYNNVFTVPDINRGHNIIDRIHDTVFDQYRREVCYLTTTRVA